MSFLFFFFNDTATTEIYTLSLHDALPISSELIHRPTRNITECFNSLELTAGEKSLLSRRAEEIGRAHV